MKEDDVLLLTTIYGMAINTYVPRPYIALAYGGAQGMHHCTVFPLKT